MLHQVFMRRMAHLMTRSERSPYETLRYPHVRCALAFHLRRMCQHILPNPLGGIPTISGQQRSTLPTAAPMPPEQTINTAELEGISIQQDNCERVGRNNVQCYFTVTSRFRDRKVSFNRAGQWGREVKMFDDRGNEYTASRIQVGDAGNPSSAPWVEANLVADVPVRTTVYFDNISTQAAKISRLDLAIRGRNKKDRLGKCCSAFQYRNIDIVN
jgi:hypothetical protein